MYSMSMSRYISKKKPKQIGCHETRAIFQFRIICHAEIYCLLALHYMILYTTFILNFFYVFNYTLYLDI